MYQDKGIELVAAPAEHHECIAEVERSIGVLRGKMESFLRAVPTSPRQAALAMNAAHNSLAKVHGYSPTQWALGRDWSPGFRLVDGAHDEVSVSSLSSPWSPQQLRIEAEKAFLDHRQREAATRAKNARVRVVSQFFPGDLVFYRRYRHPADLAANNNIDYPRMRMARWFGPARVLACETKADGGNRRPSAYVWAVAGGRLKKFHSTQLRHASEQERLIADATTIASMPWTFASLQKLMGKGVCDDECRPPRRHCGEGKKGRKRKPPRDPDDHAPPRRLNLPLLNQDMFGMRSPEMRWFLTMKAFIENVETEVNEDLEEELDVDRLLSDVRYMPPGRPVSSTMEEASGSFRARRSADEWAERPWHVQQRDSAMMTEVSEIPEDTLFSAIIDIPDDA